MLDAAKSFSYRFFCSSHLPRHLTAYLNINTCVLSVFKHQQACYEQKEWDQTSNIQQLKLSNKTFINFYFIFKDIYPEIDVWIEYIDFQTATFNCMPIQTTKNVFFWLYLASNLCGTTKIFKPMQYGYLKTIVGCC